MQKNNYGIVFHSTRCKFGLSQCRKFVLSTVRAGEVVTYFRNYLSLSETRPSLSKYFMNTNRLICHLMLLCYFHMWFHWYNRIIYTEYIIGFAFFFMIRNSETFKLINMCINSINFSIYQDKLNFWVRYSVKYNFCNYIVFTIFNYSF